VLLNHQISGDGPPLFVLHGLFGSLSNWKSIARKLSTDYRVISVDLRNHGRSPWHNDVSYTAMADDVIELMDYLGIHKAKIVGHSMGGKVAMCAALFSSSRVSEVVSVDIAPVVYSHSHIDLIYTLQDVNLDEITKRRDLDDALQPDIPEPGLRQFLSQNLVFKDDRFQWRINLPALANGMSLLTGFPPTDQGYFNDPALFVYGGNSDYVIPAYHDTTQNLFPHARFVEVPETGHWLHAEKPDVLVEHIVHFFA
jgi:esterase